MPDRRDVVVLGAGPAGAAIAAACAGRGLDVVVVAPDPAAPWPATYCAWVDDLDGVDLPWPDDGPFAHVWPSVVVHGTRRHDVQRPYGLLVNDAVQASFRSVAGLTTLARRAVEVRHLPWGSEVLLDDDEVLGARVVVDCRGSRADPSDAAQVAHGVMLDRAVVAERVRPEVLEDPCVLMDWRPARTERGRVGASFLYVLAHEGRVLLEETSLAARPPADPRLLRDRLAARVGLDLTDEAVHVEAVHIPVGVPLPDGDDRTVAFGAAAGLVHPATGYSVATSLRIAPRLAGSLAVAIGADADPVEIARAGNDAVWPRDQRRSRALQDYGLSALLRLDARQTAEFFDAFFDLEPDRWAPYMRVDVGAGDVAAVMRSVFAAVPWSVRRVLAGGDLRAVRRLLAP